MGKNAISWENAHCDHCEFITNTFSWGTIILGPASVSINSGATGLLKQVPNIDVEYISCRLHSFTFNTSFQSIPLQCRSSQVIIQLHRIAPWSIARFRARHRDRRCSQQLHQGLLAAAGQHSRGTSTMGNNRIPEPTHYAMDVTESPGGFRE